MRDSDRDTPDSDGDTYVVHHDWDEDDSLSSTVVTAVAAIRNVEPTAIDPLNEAVDPDALNTIFENRHGGAERSGATLTLRLNKCSVTIHGDGRVVVEAPGEAASGGNNVR
ncbi:HalOD1 output domain-containing protein [Halostella sp. PRR32]|uniref:HalOD1 output domain-containing protein n=1 Tax=Halostella sp. PRR32 TaxID=3098147 RepID=UPI002B1DEFC0|nr:HalOD1 output domain-containing protein [Halostella sp. PRR32]